MLAINARLIVMTSPAFSRSAIARTVALTSAASSSKDNAGLPNNKYTLNPKPNACDSAKSRSISRSSIGVPSNKERTSEFVDCSPTPTVREEVKLASGDYIDMKMYEPAMRHLLDTYIRAEESEKLSAFDDMTLVELIVERGEKAVETLPKGIREKGVSP